MTRLTLLLTVLAIPLLLEAQDPEPISYVLRFPEPHSHYVEVEATYPCEGRRSLDVYHIYITVFIRM